MDLLPRHTPPSADPQMSPGDLRSQAPANGIADPGKLEEGMLG